MWIDSHTHVTAPEFDADRDEVLARARHAGVSAFLAVGAGWGLDANEAAVALAAREPDVWAAVGVHPHDAKLLDQHLGRAVAEIDDRMQQRRGGTGGCRADQDGGQHQVGGLDDDAVARPALHVPAAVQVDTVDITAQRDSFRRRHPCRASPAH